MPHGGNCSDLALDERWSRLFAEHPNALEQHADEALEEHREGKTVLLDPQEL